MSTQTAELKVAEANLSDRSGVVIIEGPTQESVMSPAAKQKAINAATEQLGKCGVSGGESAYPVDADGNTSEKLVLGQEGSVAAYRCDYNLTSSL